ncbi:hypothetical protein ES703_118712 [subsurface metagenome]
MRTFYSGNRDSRFLLFLNYGVYLPIRVISINVAELATIDDDDVQGIFLSSAYLPYQLALKFPGYLMATRLGIENLADIQKADVFKTVKFHIQCAAGNNSIISKGKMTFHAHLLAPLVL